MSDKCKVIGSFGLHKLPKGYMDSPPYLIIEKGTVDCVGAMHARLYAECERCGDRFVVGFVHLTKDGAIKG